MPVQFKDEAQRNDVDLIINDLIDNAADALRNNDIKAIYERIYSQEAPGAHMQGDRAGKTAEVLLDMYPELLSNIDEFPDGMFYESDLEEITIPVNVRKLGWGVFALSKIKEINYEGTREQWDALIRNSSSGWNAYSPRGDSITDHAEINFADMQEAYECKKELKEDWLNEAMTAKEINFKRNVLNFLRQDGFVTFADYLNKFHFNYATSEQFGQPFVAAISPEKGIVLINPHVDSEAISMLLRHEAGHQVFKHVQHMFAKLKKMGVDDPNDKAYQFSNIVGDYHISNTLYDEDDKDLAKHIIIENGKEVSGLVTDRDFPEKPEYWDMDFDELWDALIKEYNIKKEDLAKQKPEEGGDGGDPQEMSQEMIDGYNAAIDAYEKGEITQDQLKQWFEGNK